MDKGLTPEERLLKLIKDGPKAVKAVKEDEPAKEPVSVQTGSKKPFTQSLRSRLLLDRQRFKFTIVKMNKVFLVVFLIALIYTIYDLGVFLIPRLTTIAEEKNVNIIAEEKVPSTEKDSQQQKDYQPLTYYMQEIEKRGLFKSVIADKTAAAGQAQAEPERIKLDEIAKTLALKGIVAGEVPQAIIEDTKAGKTYFVTKKDNIGEVAIEEIRDNSVKIKLGEQSTELVL